MRKGRGLIKPRPSCAFQTLLVTKPSKSGLTISKPSQSSIIDSKPCEQQVPMVARPLRTWRETGAMIRTASREIERERGYDIHNRRTGEERRGRREAVSDSGRE